MNNIKTYTPALQIIKVKFLGPTNHRGSRIKLTDTRFNVSKTLSFNYKYNSGAEQAEQYLKDHGFNVIGRSFDKQLDYIVCDAVKGQQVENSNVFTSL